MGLSVGSGSKKLKPRPPRCSEPKVPRETLDEEFKKLQQFLYLESRKRLSAEANQRQSAQRSLTTNSDSTFSVSWYGPTTTCWSKSKPRPDKPTSRLAALTINCPKVRARRNRQKSPKKETQGVIEWI